MSYITGFSQNVVAVPENSSDTNLGSLGEFIGEWHSTLNVVGIQVSLWTDQNCDVYIEQSPGLKTGNGTVSFNDGVAVSGVGTNFVRDFRVGDPIYLDSGGVVQAKVIASIIGITSLTVTVATTGGSLSGKSYQWYPATLNDKFEFSSYKKNWGDTLTIINSYFRVRVENDTTTATDVFSLQSVLCPIAIAVPRALTEDGRFKTENQIVEAQTGHRAFVDHANNLSTATSVKLVGSNFNQTQKDANFWVETAAGPTGTYALAGSVYTLRTGSGTGTTKLSSVRTARYNPGTTNQFRGIVKTRDAGNVGNTLNWGIYDTSNGYFFQLAGTSLNIVTRSGGVDTVVAKADWNRFAYQYDLATYNVFDIKYSLSSVGFYLNGTLVHDAEIKGATDPIVQSLELPVTFECNAVAGADAYLDILQGVIWRVGEFKTSPAYVHIAGSAATVCKFSGGMLHKIIVGKGVNNATITIWDNTAASAPIISILQLPNSTTPTAIEYNAPFYTGLTVQSSSASTDITVIYE